MCQRILASSTACHFCFAGRFPHLPDSPRRAPQGWGGEGSEHIYSKLHFLWDNMHDGVRRGQHSRAISPALKRIKTWSFFLHLQTPVYLSIFFLFLAWATASCRYANGIAGNLPNDHLMNRNIVIFQWKVTIHTADFVVDHWDDFFFLFPSL